MALLLSAMDIDDSKVSRLLDELGKMFGVMNMTQAYLLIEPFMEADGQQIAFVVNEENCFERIRLFCAMSMFNWACVNHEEFQIMSIDMGVVILLKRQHSVEVHTQATNKALLSIYGLIEKYGTGYANS